MSHVQKRLAGFWRHSRGYVRLLSMAMLVPLAVVTRIIVSAAAELCPIHNHGQ